MRIAFTIPGTPEGKRRPRTRVIGRMATIYSDPADKAREAVIRQLAREAMAGREPFEGAVRVTVEAVFEVTPSWTKKRKQEALDGVFHIHKPDGDNIIKSVLDGLNPDPKAKTERDRAPFCLLDDAQAAEQLIRKRYGEPARVEVVIEAIGTSEACLI